MRESGLWAKDFHAAAVRADDDVLIAAFRDATDALFYAVRLQEHARQLEIPTLVGLTVHTDIEAPDPLDAEYAGLADAHSRIAPVGGIVVGESVYGALSGSKFALPGGLFEKQITIDQTTGRQAFVLERQKMEALDQALRSLLITIPSGKSSSLIKVLALVFLTAFTGLLWKWLPSLQTPEPDRPQTIAVLPFEDTTGDLAVRAMVRGLSDDLFNAIAEVHGLNLVARRAARTLDHSEKSVQEIGEILNASLLLEGDIRTDGGEYSISTWITETDSGIERWNHIIEKPRERLAEVRLELPAAVASELNLDAAFGTPGAQVSDIDPAVYPLFLEAIGLLKLPQGEESLGRAESLLERVITASPDYLPARAALCRTYLDRFAYQRDAADFERANAQCMETLAGAEQNVEVLLALGELNRLQGDFDAAESYYIQGLDLDSSNVELTLGLARVKDKQGLADEAERLLRDMILLEPGYWHIHVRLGQLYMSSGRSDEAISEFSIAETLVPTEPNVINRLGAAHYYAGDFPRAAEFFERALQNNQTPSALSNSASVWFLAGDYERAATYYLQAAELAPSDFRIWSNLADAESQIPGREGDARAHYQLSLQLAEENLAVNEKDYVALYTIAWIAANIGSPDVAQEQIAEALQVAPDDPDVLYYAAQVYNLLGNKPLATANMIDAVGRGFPEDVLKATPALIGLFQDNQ
jgi:tetratricopeptide (TPR) repeat protein